MWFRIVKECHPIHPLVEVEMSYLSWLYRNGLWLSILVFLACLGLLVYLIRDIVRVMRQAHLLSVPLSQEQQVEFTEAGRVAMCIEGPRFTTGFAHLRYALLGPEGRPAEGKKSLFRPHTSGTSKVRMVLEYYEIPFPGRYTLRVFGLDPEHSPRSDHRIVFMKPHLARTSVRVVGVVLAGMVLIGTAILFLLRLVLLQDGP